MLELPQIGRDRWKKNVSSSKNNAEADRGSEINTFPKFLNPLETRYFWYLEEALQIYGRGNYGKSLSSYF